MIRRFQKAIRHPALIAHGLKQILHRYAERSYASEDAACVLARPGRALFLDLGANLGQGHAWFSKYFNGDHVDFELFEPNPYCLAELEKLPDVKSGKVKLHGVGVGAQAGRFKFYGLDDAGDGPYAQGGSIVKDHNSAWYAASTDQAIDVEIMDFSAFLKMRSPNYQTVIVKMDIEGAEVDLLEAMIENGTISLIDYLYVEFHACYQDRIKSRATKTREDAIIANLKNRKSLRLRIWH